MPNYPNKKKKASQGKVAPLKKFDKALLEEEDWDMLKAIKAKRVSFDAYLETVDLERFTCPACGYPTLEEKGNYECCVMCLWEEDGNDDQHNPALIRPPNHISLMEARVNIGFMLAEFEESESVQIDPDPKRVTDHIEDFLNQLKAGTAKINTEDFASHIRMALPVQKIEVVVAVDPEIEPPVDEEE